LKSQSKSYVYRAGEYADKVISGETPACLYVKQACQRFISDLDRKDLDFDSYEANRWCEFLEGLPHVKGKWAAKGELLKLSDWQIFCTVNIYGWKLLKTGKRRFREAYIEVGRKNGKTFYTAGIGLGMMAIDGEYGAEIYCGATTEKQAFEIFRPAKQICERTPQLREDYGIEVNAKTLTIMSNGSRFEPIIGDPGDGASPSFGIADEFHEHKNSDQVDTMVTGMGARDNPIMFYITTAGVDTGGPCYAKRDDVIQILKGAVSDDSIFGIIYTIDKDDQWDTIDAQIKANPNYGVSISTEFLEGQLKQARRSAAKQTAYKTKHLNMWVGAKAAWMNMLAYQACRKKKLDIKDFKGRRCIVALDLATKKDIADMAILFPPENGGKWTAFCRHYLPEDVITDGGNTRYKAWHADGWFTATPGNITDFEYIEDDLRELKSDYEIISVPYDPFQATYLATRLLEDGFPMVEVGATVKNLSQPMKELEAKILEKNIQFQSDPVLMWMFGNVTAKLDKKDNIFPNKERFENKIDGVVALIMAMNRAILDEETGSLDDFLANPVSV